ncbi:hypothetical protein M011DRAFT_480467 [Sporormia fimetaria CBS 119925]|uniref:Uncharacterized protein n=1 Tax=Sporormia fimetaria CBS 119925 TaxID=1340428 RepID=A0A6A6V1V4_9PLEO|nr:hypothetical protein M011DRAFT_480467 [Sporormia fimetaria CBS 119925]
MSDGLNDARAIRITEIMTDFRNLQYYLSQLRATPTAEEYYLEGFVLLRNCTTEAQTILAKPFAAAPSSSADTPDKQREQLKGIIADAAVRRFQCQKLYLQAHAGLRWVSTRTSILRGQKPNATHLTALQAADVALRNELLAISDAHVEYTLRNQDAAEGKWLAEDPTLAQIQQMISRR